MKVCLLGFYKMQKDWEVLKKKTDFMELCGLAFSFYGHFEVYVTHFTWHWGFHDCSVLPGFPINP